ncbi:beta-glucoside operon transcriptional antiterminator [Enterococcus sp. AZ135]|uniref:PRD domain-containing protein n=1 Tax=unclassified Enterococcus TaxID=2608891 RepID=UPI003F23B5A9
MQVLKVMNNSLVLALDEAGTECILMGKGIGFNKAIGHEVYEEEIEKVFILTDNKMLTNFVQLASTLDDTYINLVKQIIDYAASSYQIEVKDYLYLSLSDHISFVTKRLKAGNVGENFNYPDVMLYHKNEYLIGKYAVELINKELQIQLPDSEATAIGLHFVNAKLESSSHQRDQSIAKLMNNFEKIVQRIVAGKINRDTFTYSRFLTHLNYFSERVYEGNLFPDEDKEELYQTLAIKMTKEVAIIRAFEIFIDKEYGLNITKQEKIYLLVHLHRIVEEQERKV